VPTTTASIELLNKRSDRPPYTRMVQNFLFVWLDGSIDEINNTECRDIITKLRQVVNIVDTFTDADECIDHVTNIMEEKTFMIVSETFSKTIIPIVQDILHVISIYIFCGNNAGHEQWAKQSPKLKGVFADIIPTCEALKQTVKDCGQIAVALSFVALRSANSTKVWTN
jgi:hypothetical protein